MNIVNADTIAAHCTSLTVPNHEFIDIIALPSTYFWGDVFQFLGCWESASNGLSSRVEVLHKYCIKIWHAWLIRKSCTSFMYIVLHPVVLGVIRRHFLCLRIQVLRTKENSIKYHIHSLCLPSVFMCPQLKIYYLFQKYRGRRQDCYQWDLSFNGLNNKSDQTKFVVISDQSA